MTRATLVLLSIGTALFVALLAWQGFGAVAATLAAAGWGLALVAAFHLLPLALDAFAILVVLERRGGHLGARGALVARWVGESVNSLLPAGQLGGPVIMVRQLAQRGVAMADAAAAIAVSTTMQLASQVVFAIVGIAVFAAHGALTGAFMGVGTPLAIAVALLTAMVVGFYGAQRRGMFGRLSRLASRSFGARRLAGVTVQADAIDRAVRALYLQRAKVVATFVASLVAWIVGTGEVWLALDALGHPVGWRDALLLESVGQAIRGAAFAIPGSLGAQEGGFLLLAPLVGIPLDTALALSLVKRVRELALGLPGIVYLHVSERQRQRHHAAPIAVVD